LKRAKSQEGVKIT